jgi:hypothetical protein
MALAETKESKPLLMSNFMKRFQLVGAGLIVLALLVASAWYLNGTKNPAANLTSMLSEPKITRAGDNAFGSLANVQNARGQGGGGNMDMTSTNSVAPAPESTEGYGTTPDVKLIAPEKPVNFRYIYKGEELTLVQDKVDVLKRQKNESNNLLADFVNRITFGLVNLNSFKNTRLESFNFVEDRDLGYMVNVNLADGSVNINENWPRWEALYTPCPLEDAARSSLSTSRLACEPPRIKPSEVPADQVLIDAANAFLDEHSIPRSVYGEPVINKDWRIQYERATDKSTIWIPEIMNVIYPLMLDGQQVYDESGNMAGLNVAVRFRPEVRVSSVYELTTQNYESSSYEAVTDVDRVMKLVEQGGFRNYYYAESGARNVDIELGTPEISYVKLWNYEKNVNEELLVPALIFPVTKEPTDVGPYYWYRKNVIVPLVKQILDNENDDPIRIMPMGGAAEPAVTNPPVMQDGQE